MAMPAMPLLISTLWLPHYFRYLHAVLTNTRFVDVARWVRRFFAFLILKNGLTREDRFR